MTENVRTIRTDEIEAFRQLKTRYFRCLDTKAWEGFRSVFVREPALGPIEYGFPDYLLAPRPPEARYQVADDNTGIDAFVERHRRLIGHLITTHHDHQPEIELTGDDEATGIWPMEDVLVWNKEGYHLRGTGH